MWRKYCCRCFGLRYSFRSVESDQGSGKTHQSVPTEPWYICQHPLYVRPQDTFCYLVFVVHNDSDGFGGLNHFSLFWDLDSVEAESRQSPVTCQLERWFFSFRNRLARHTTFLIWTIFNRNHVGGTPLLCLRVLVACIKNAWASFFLGKTWHNVKQWLGYAYTTVSQ